jgi:cell division protein FtsB
LLKHKLKIVKILILTIVFSFFIFFIKNYFFYNSVNEEENYIEFTSKQEEIEKKDNRENNLKPLSNDEKKQIKKYFDEKNLDNSIDFLYFPNDFKLETIDLTKLISFILKSTIFGVKIDNSIDPK